MSTVDDASERSARLARLEWHGGDALGAADRERLFGPGAPFEIEVADVLGAPVEVYKQRPKRVFDLLRTSAARWPQREFVVAGERTVTFAEAVDLALRVAQRWATDHGVVAGDRVAIASANSLEYVIAFWASAALGSIYVGLNGWWTGAELRHGIELTTPKIVFADARRVERLAGERLTDVPVHALENLLGDLGAEACTPGAIDEDDPLLVLFTSGTTGRPKGAIVTHHNAIHYAQTVQAAGAVGAALAGIAADPDPPQSSSLLVAPLFHVSGVVPLVMNAANGARTVLSPPGRWDETVHLELTEKYRITSWGGVPTQLFRLLEHPDFDRYDLSSLRLIGGGGATFPPELIRLVHTKLPGVMFSIGYGMSETMGMGATIGGPFYLEHPDSIGTAQVTAKIEVRGDDGSVLPEGEVGEICLRHGAVFRGYWNNPEATAACLDEQRWYRSGDFGRVDNGLLYMESRRRDLIIRGGENIYPIEIENRLIEHPQVAEVAVIGVPHRVLGQEVLAVVVPHPGPPPDPAELRAFVAERLAAFKVPAHIVLRDALPYTESAKVMKHVLEQEYPSAPAG